MRGLKWGAALSVLLLPYASLAQCPELPWHHHIHGTNGGNAAAWPNLAINSSNGNLLVGATAYGVDELGFGTLNDSFINALGGNVSLYMGMVSPNGTSNWIRSINTTSTLQSEDVCATDDGGYFLIGAFRPDVIAEDTTISLTPNTGNGYFMFKYNAQGSIVWIRHAENGFSAAARAVALGSDILVAFVFEGELEIGPEVFQSEGAERDMLLVRFDADGTVVWSKHITGTGSLFIENMACFSDTCIVQGRFNEEIDFDGNALTVPSSEFRVFQFGFTAIDGSYLWKKKVTTSAINGNLVTITGTARISETEFLTLGHFDTPILEFDGQSVVNHGDQDAFIAAQRIEDGTVIWLKALGGSDSDEIRGICKVSSGVALGITTKSSSIDYEGFDYTHPDSGNDHPFILAIDDEGKPNCSISPVITEGSANIIGLESFNGNLYGLSGFSGQFISSDESTSSIGTRDLLLWKTCLPCDTLTSIAETTGVQPTLQVYPNPASQAVRIQDTGNRLQLKGITITDMLGHAVLHQKTTANDNNIDISGLASGLYTVAATFDNGETARRRLVVQHR